MERRYTLLKNKYNELLLPTLFTIISGSLCGFIDVVIAGFLLDSTQLSVLFLGSPLKYVTSIFYTLFGQGGILLALRAKSNLEPEKNKFLFYHINIRYSFNILAIYFISCTLYRRNTN